MQGQRFDSAIKVVSSLECDHVYNEVKIKLFDEKYESKWEVDAWDPRIIDISKRYDGSVKNISSLDYGYRVEVINTFFVHELKGVATPPVMFTDLRKVQSSIPVRSPTPEAEILTKHPRIYDDYTIEKALKKRKLCKSNSLGYLQKASNWQKKKKRKL